MLLVLLNDEQSGVVLGSQCGALHTWTMITMMLVTVLSAPVCSCQCSLCNQHQHSSPPAHLHPGPGQLCPGGHDQLHHHHHHHQQDRQCVVCVF